MKNSLLIIKDVDMPLPVIKKVAGSRCSDVYETMLLSEIDTPEIVTDQVVMFVDTDTLQLGEFEICFKEEDSGENIYVKPTDFKPSVKLITSIKHTSLIKRIECERCIIRVAYAGG